MKYYVKLKTVEAGHTTSEYYYGVESGPFTERRTAEQAAANALKQQDIISARIIERDEDE